jgi:hypothetical protein
MSGIFVLVWFWGFFFHLPSLLRPLGRTTSNSLATRIVLENMTPAYFSEDFWEMKLPHLEGRLLVRMVFFTVDATQTQKYIVGITN